MLLGIRHAEGQFVHLANPRLTKISRRRWTGLVAALSVTLTVCDAQQVGLSPSYRFLLFTQNLASFQIQPTEQKAPQALDVWRAYSETLTTRSQASSVPRDLDGTPSFE